MKITQHSAFILATILTLTGCTTLGEHDATVAEGGVLGALGGAIIGGIIDGKEGAVKGGLAGGAIGLAAGHFLAIRKDSYADQNQAIAEETSWNATAANQMRAENQELTKRISLYRTEISQLQSKRLSSAEKSQALQKQSVTLKQEIQQANQKLNEVNVALSKSKQQYQQYGVKAPASSSSELKTWNSNIAQLEKERNVLQGKINELNAMNNSLGI